MIRGVTHAARRPSWAKSCCAAVRNINSPGAAHVLGCSCGPCRAMAFGGSVNKLMGSSPFVRGLSTSSRKGILERLAQGPVLCDGGYVFELEKRGYVQDRLPLAPYSHTPSIA
jgi:hypothetical protein